jgi:hypothetical protein
MRSTAEVLQASEAIVERYLIELESLDMVDWSNVYAFDSIGAIHAFAQRRSMFGWK